MKNRIIVMIMAAMFALPAMAQMSKQAAPTGFQSTSTMQGSGSAYSSTPVLNSDGTVAAPLEASSGPRRGKKDDDDDITIVTPGQTGTPAPVGEPWVLLVMAAAAAATIAVRRRRAAGSSAGE